MYPIGSNGASQAILDAPKLTQNASIIDQDREPTERIHGPFGNLRASLRGGHVTCIAQDLLTPRRNHGTEFALGFQKQVRRASDDQNRGSLSNEMAGDFPAKSLAGSCDDC